METKNKGKVFLIGAGPGDPGLITVKGKRHLENCQAVIYDNLLAPELIVSIPPETEKYYVGKRAGVHPVPQDEINELMSKLASEGKCVARLKGSDPLIFGRGGEEAKFLREHGIEFEIINGVTSGIAGPAYAGIPCTERHKASFVMFVTGHKASDKYKTSVPWDWVAKAKNGTIVVFMGVGEIANIVQQMIDNGMSPDMPAAVIERATFPSQRVFTSPLKDLPATVEKEKIMPPALFVFGEVVSLRLYLDWFSDRPLIGKRIMVTRAVDQAAPLYERLRQLGAEPLPFPTIATEPFHDDDGWDAVFDSPEDDSWLVFTSENGVTNFFEQFTVRTGDIRYLARFNIAAVGTGTARALLEHHIEADFVPSKATVNDLAAEMRDKIDLDGAVIVRVRGDLAPDTLEKELPADGATVIPLTVYRTFHPDWPEEFKEKLFEHPPHAILFTSGSTVKGMYHNLNDDEVGQIMSGADIFSLGPVVSRTLEEHGFKATAQAEEFTLPGLINTVLGWYASGKS